jgi:hypothetical protein
LKDQVNPLGPLQVPNLTRLLPFALY